MRESSRRRSCGDAEAARFQLLDRVPADAVRPSPIGMTGLAACGAVVIVVVTLSVLIWIVTSRAVQERRAEVQDRAEQVLQGQAATMAETVAHELLLIDQSLTIIQAAWTADSDAVDLLKWQARMPALTSVADDLFIADDNHIIRQDILPKAVGQGVGSAYVTFPHGSLEHFSSDGTRTKESLVALGQAGAPLDVRQFLMYIIRPLDHPKGWLVGASFRSTEVPKLFAEAVLGFNPVVALVDTKRGVVQTVVGPAARRLKTDLSQTALFISISRTPSGTWLGETALDGVQRIHAFHRVADRDMVVLVAATYTEVMASADGFSSGARSLASAATALVAIVGALVLWEIYIVRYRHRQKRISVRNRSELERLRSAEAANIATAQLNDARLKILLDHTGDGIALVDGNLRLVQWNQPFLDRIGTEARRDMPLDALLRQQAANGLFETVDDAEAEIARRVRVLRTGGAAGLPQVAAGLPQVGAGQQKYTLRSLLIGDGGLLLVLGAGQRSQFGAATRQSAMIDETEAAGRAVSDEPTVTAGQ